MYSSISRSIRETLYANLQDHYTVANHPGVPGLGKRLFWLTHQQPEEDKDDAVSKVDVYEVEVVTALVSHLIRQCHYAPDEIAVLSPYLSQLRRPRIRLLSAAEIIVDDRDEIQLQQVGLQSEADVPTPGTMARTNLSQALRLAIVDTFQGENAKVVVVSLVRSNHNKNCGFLRTINRTNVLLSRAQHGIYLIGDGSCSREQPTWARVIDILEEEDHIGPAQPLLCPRHPGNQIMVSIPDDFVRLSPQGGCDRKCADRLNCGHQW
jgi:superfamily I DNA and/or RNA helicase